MVHKGQLTALHIKTLVGLDKDQPEPILLEMRQYIKDIPNLWVTCDGRTVIM